MGGWGSGPYGPMGDRVRKRTVEETICLHVQTFKECLDNKTITCSWNDGKSKITVITKGDHIHLLYKVNEDSVSTMVDIDKTKVGFGERIWFNCPCCGEKTARLYFVDKEFFCRVCQNLTYFTCQESGDPLDYLGLKIRRLQRKLGMDKPEIYETPIFKPKNLHYKTFMKLRNELIKIQEEREAYFVSKCNLIWGTSF
jgi:hypothetical protein